MKQNPGFDSARPYLYSVVPPANTLAHSSNARSPKPKPRPLITKALLPLLTPLWLLLLLVSLATSPACFQTSVPSCELVQPMLASTPSGEASAQRSSHGMSLDST